MKKVILLLVIAVTAITTNANAQPPQGGGQRGAQMQERLKQIMIDEAKLSPAKADSVLAIQKEFQPKMGEVRRDQTLSEDDKKAKLKTIGDDRAKRWKQAGLTDDEAKKIQIMYDNLQNRMGGGGRPAGGMPPANK